MQLMISTLLNSKTNKIRGCFAKRFLSIASLFFSEQAKRNVFRNGDVAKQ
jgi:hypothetical protein